MYGKCLGHGFLLSSIITATAVITRTSRTGKCVRQNPGSSEPLEPARPGQARPGDVVQGSCRLLGRG